MKHVLFGPHHRFPARIRYLGDIRLEDDIDPSRGGFWQSVVAFITGSPARGFVRPAGICVRKGVLAVADPGAGLFHVLYLKERRWLSISKTSDGTLVSPVDVACFENGQFVVADSALETLWLYGSDAQPLGKFTDVKLRRPTGLALDEERNRLFVAETLAHRVQSFDMGGTLVGSYGSEGSGPEQMHFPTFMSLDPKGGLWVTDSLNFRLQHFFAEGNYDRQLGNHGDSPGSFARPRGLDTDTEGRIFVVDGLFDAIQVFRADGQLLLVFGERGSKPGQFWLPSDVALDTSGHLFVSDSYNQRIQIFSYHPGD